MDSDRPPVVFLSATSRPVPSGLVCLACLVLSTVTAVAQWNVVRESAAVPLGKGASYGAREVSGAESVKLSLVFFDAAECELHVAAQQPPQFKAKRIAEVLRLLPAVAGVNGGYFDMNNFGPSGLEIAGGVATGTWDKTDPLVGSLVVRKGMPALLWQGELADTRDTTEMVQCSPQLVRGGAAVKGLGDANGPQFPRTFVASDGGKRWVLGVCRNATIPGLAQMLASQRVITEFRIDRALNLDGGPSSGLWCREPNGVEHYDKEGTRVRNIISVTPRK